MKNRILRPVALAVLALGLSIPAVAPAAEGSDPFSRFSVDTAGSGGVLSFGADRRNTGVRGGWRDAVRWDNRRAKSADFGRGVKVAVMDGLVRCNHKVIGKCSAFESGSGRYTGFDDHGTLVAGMVIGKNKVGVASRARVLSYGVFDDNGWVAGSLSTSMRDAAARGARIANWSFGPSQAGQLAFTGDLDSVKAHRDQILVVMAAGNSGRNLRGLRYKSSDRNPLSRDLRNLIIVGALNSKGTAVANYSNRPGGGCMSGRNGCSRKGKYREYFIVAPGTVYGPGGRSKNKFLTSQGTSFAAPIVSGAAALIQARWPKLEPHQVRAILLRTATDRGKRGTDNRFGRGVLNIRAALKPVKGRIVSGNGRTLDTGGRQAFQVSGATGWEKVRPKMYDAFGRDFSVAETRMQGVPRQQSRVALAGMTMGGSLFVSATAVGNETFDGIAMEGLGLVNLNYMPSDAMGARDWRDLPGVLSDLSLDATHVAIALGEGASVFGVVSDQNTLSPSRPNAVGLRFDIGGTTAVSLGYVREQGRYGVRSLRGIGLAETSTGYMAALAHQQRMGPLAVSAEASMLLYPERIRSGFLSTDGYGFGSLDLAAAYDLDADGRTAVFVRGRASGLRLGSMETSIRGMRGLSDLYRHDAEIAMGLNAAVGDAGSLNLAAFERTDRNRGFSLGYEFRF